MKDKLTVLVVGATGSIGKLVVQEALQQGHSVRALVRSPAKAKGLPKGAESIVGDLTAPGTLRPAVEGIDAVVFTHGSTDGTKAGSESVDYGGVRNVLDAFGSQHVRIALMTAIGVTVREGSCNRQTEAHDWKRRGERLVRASGNPYTIVRPGWFDYNKPDEHKLVFLQGDTRRAGNASDGVIARQQLAEVLVRSLTSEQAAGKTFEPVAEKGAAKTNFDALFVALKPDKPSQLDGVQDLDNQPLAKESERVQADLDAVRNRKR